jgi:nitroreductase
VSDEFSRLVRSRRMVRAFRRDPIDRATLERIVDLASRSPSAGKTQGWHLVVLEGDETERFWGTTMDAETRERFRWKHLLDTPVIALSFADPQAYLDRYSASDKSRTGLGDSLAAWPVPYWTIDASFATMTMLLAAHDEGLGALFFGVFNGEQQLREGLRIPTHLQLIGAVALGYERTPEASEANDAAFSRGASANLPRLSTDDIVHYGGW